MKGNFVIHYHIRKPTYRIYLTMVMKSVKQKQTGVPCVEMMFYLENQRSKSMILCVIIRYNHTSVIILPFRY